MLFFFYFPKAVKLLILFLFSIVTCASSAIISLEAMLLLNPTNLNRLYFNFHVFKIFLDFLAILLLLSPSLIPLWPESILCMICFLLNLSTMMANLIGPETHSRIFVYSPIPCLSQPIRDHAPPWKCCCVACINIYHWQ